ncbi:MAG TPA: M56 family metallopeptidase [Phycisphaerae bacterium]|nr:M56 family metallopeptidase [Phycisphaerae bacterium]
MNLSNLLDAAWCVRLTETLLHFVWQGALIALLVWAAVGVLRRGSANARYTVCLCALFVMAACPPATFVVLEASSEPAPAVSGAHPAVTGAVAAGEAARDWPRERLGRRRHDWGRAPAAPAATDQAGHSGRSVSHWRALSAAAWQRYAPYAVACYAIGVFVMLVRMLVGVGGGQRLRRESQIVEDRALLGAFWRQVRRIGVRSAPVLRYCEQVAVPTVVGAIRPMILLPLSLASGFTAEQVEVLLAHELAHIRRWDHLVNLLQRLIEAVLFFHPAVWFVSRRVRVERERCCDDMVVAHSGGHSVYVDSLVRMAELSYASGHPKQLASVAVLGAADRPCQLRDRVARLLEGPRSDGLRLARSWVVVLALVAAVAVFASVRSAAADRVDADAPQEQVQSAGDSSGTSGDRVGAGETVEFDLRFEKLPAKQADYYCIQGMGRPNDGFEKPSFCQSQNAKVWHSPNGTFRTPILVDESKGTGAGYDTLYIDFNNDGDFLDDPIYKISAFDGDKGPDTGNVHAYFENVYMVCNPERDEYAHVQMFIEGYGESGDISNCVIIPQQWAVGTMTVGDKKMPIALIDRDWNDRVTDFGGYREGDSRLFRRGDYLLLGIDGEESLIRGEQWLGRDGSARGILARNLVLDSGAYEFETLSEDAGGVTMRLQPAAPAGGTVELPTGARDSRLLMVGAETTVLLSAPGESIEVPADAYYLPHHNRTTVEVQEGESVSVQVPMVSGTVVDATTGQPVPEFTVIPATVYSQDGHISVSRSRGRTFTGGRYSITFDRPSSGTNYRYRVWVEADGYYPAESEPFDVGAGEQILDFSLTPGYGPSGVVKSAHGAPVAGAKVGLATKRNSIYVRNGELRLAGHEIVVETDAAGAFSFPPRIDPYAMVAVADEGFGQATQEQFESSRQIVLQPWGQIEGELRIGAKPGQRQQMRIWHAEQRPYEPDRPRIDFGYDVGTDEKGRFTVSRVRPGEVQVGRSIRRGRIYLTSHAKTIDVEPGQTARVTIGGTGRPVIGRVTAPMTLAFEIDWTSDYADNTIQLKQIGPSPPKDLPPEQHREWYAKWNESKEGKAYRRAARYYAVIVKPDRSFRVEDVPAGEYVFEIGFPAKRDDGDDPSSRRRFQQAVYARHRFDVPKMEGGRSDKPLDLGEVELRFMSRDVAGRPAAPFDLQGLAGGRVRLADYRGQYVLLHFWLSSCEHCVKEAEGLRAIRDEYREDDRLAIVGVSLDASSADARRFASRHGLRWAQGWAGDWSTAKIATDYDVRAVPLSLLVSPDGRVMRSGLGVEELKAFVAERLKRDEAAKAAAAENEGQADDAAPGDAKSTAATQSAAE